MTTGRINQVTVVCESEQPHAAHRNKPGTDARPYRVFLTVSSYRLSKKIDIDASAVRTSSVCDDDLVKGRTARVSRALHSLGVVFSSNYAIENHAFDHCAAARATNRAPPDENRVNDRQRVRLASRAWCLYQKRGSSPMAGPSV
jgi:hypothetical protein